MIPGSLPTFPRGEHALNSLSFQPFPLTEIFSLFVFFSFFSRNSMDLLYQLRTPLSQLSVFHFTRGINWKLIEGGDKQAAMLNRSS